MRVSKFLGLLVCIAGLSACDDKDPTNEGTGEPFAQVVSRATTFQHVGGQFTLTAALLDRTGTKLPQAATATVSNPASLRLDSVVFRSEVSETFIYITPTALDTTARVIVTNGMFSDTVRVSALPAGLRIVVSDTIPSGQTRNVTVQGLNAAGVSFGNVPFRVISVGDTTIAGFTAAGALTGRAAGVTRVVVQGPGGVLRDSTFFTVAPGPFSGTAGTATAFSGGQAITFTAGAGQGFDTDTNVTLNTPTSGFLAARGTNTLTFVIPFGTPAGTYNATFSNVGPNQLALRGTVTVPAVGATDTFEPNDSPATSSGALTVGTDLYGSLSASDADDFYTLTVTEAGRYRLSVAFNTPTADVDMFLLNAAGTLRTCADDFIGCTAATTANPETGTTATALAPGTYRIYVNLYTAASTPTTYRLSVTRL